MKPQNVLAGLLLVVLLGVGMVPLACAQAPEAAPVPVPAGLKAEMWQLRTIAGVYALPKETAYKDVIAQIDAEVTAAGWTADTLAPDCPAGINAGAWTADQQGAAAFIVPAREGSTPFLLTTLVGASEEAAASEPITVPVALGAEMIPMPIVAAMYALPAGTTAADVMGQYETALAAAGWAAEPLAPDCEAGINGGMWGNEPNGFIVLYLPADKPEDPPGMITMYMTAPGEAAPPAQGSAGSAALAVCPCCTELPAGKGGIYFENFIGERLIEDVGSTKVEIPAKQGDAAGCAFVVLDPGKYHLIGKTESAKAGGEADVEVVAGQISHFPIAIQGY